MTILDHKDLFVWKTSIILVHNIYNLCKNLPKSEQYVLIPQIQRSAISISSNIAEGHGRSTRKDYLHFLYIAKGSTLELDAQILIIEAIYPTVNTKEVLASLVSTRRLLSLLIHGLQSPPKTTAP